MNQTLKLHILLPSLIGSLAFASSPAWAANINVTVGAVQGACYNNGDQCDPADFDPSIDCTLQDALDIAECNGESDVVTLAAGTYDADTADTFFYTASDGENFSLTITGTGDTTIFEGGTRDYCLDIDTRFAGGDDATTILLQGILCQNGFSGGPGGGVAINVNDADVTVQNCSFENNVSQEWGGGLYVNGEGDSEMILNANFFLLNSNTNDQGGGMYASSDIGNIRVVNNIVTQNTCNDSAGGGMYLLADSGLVEIVNNTIFDNQAPSDTNGNGGGLGVEMDNTTSINIYNNIIFGNSAGINGDDIWTCEEGATVNLFNNDFTEYFSESVMGGSCGSAVTINQGSNLDVDPAFVNAAGADLHLTAASTVIDKGDLNPPGGLPTPDFDGVTRPQGALPDMGALEFQIIPTPTPSASPTPSPTPIASGLLAFGDGFCALNRNWVDSHGTSAAGIAALLGGGILALAALRRANKR